MAPDKAQADVVEEWARLEITYDLPAAPLLPESQSGTPQRSAMDGARAGGDVEIELVVEDDRDTADLSTANHVSSSPRRSAAMSSITLIPPVVSKPRSTAAFQYLRACSS